MQLLTTAVTYRNRIGFVPKSCPELTRKDRIIEALGAAHIPKVDEGPLYRYFKICRNISASRSSLTSRSR